jgi:predicted AAA+ superfamily ATPase
MMVKREKYIEEIRKVIGKQVIKVLLGMRRVGKSTLYYRYKRNSLSKVLKKIRL